MTAGKNCSALLEDSGYQWLPVDADLAAAASGRWLERFRDQELTLCDAASFEALRRERIKSAFAFDLRFEMVGHQTLTG